MKDTIKHVWLDFSETLAFVNKEVHHKLCYETYSEIVGKPVSPELILEYEVLYNNYSHSNSAVFHSLGKSAGFWSERIGSINPKDLYRLADPTIPEVLKQLKEKVPISIFSNIHLNKVLPALGIDEKWFTHIIQADMVKEPKPALEGFYKMVELSNLPAEQVLYVGDYIEKDILPAKMVGLKTGLMWGKSDKADYSFEKFDDVMEIFK